MALNSRITDWSDKRVWLIGASTGIGASLAGALLGRGARVAVTARNEAALADAEAILEKQPGTRGVLVEQPEVLPDADRLLSERGVRDRCEFQGGSFFDPIPARGEVWTMCQVLHDCVTKCQPHHQVRLPEYF